MCYYICCPVQVEWLDVLGNVLRSHRLSEDVGYGVCHVISGGNLHAAAWEGDEALVLRWVDRAGPEDLPPLLLSPDMHGATALHLAAMQVSVCVCVCVCVSDFCLSRSVLVQN